jgi:hypothetical protein
MYAQLSEDDDAPLEGVIYVTERVGADRLVRRNAHYSGLDALRLLTLDIVIQQTWTAARVSCLCEPPSGGRPWRDRSSS